MNFRTRAEALLAGDTDATLRAARLRGDLTSILRGCTADTAAWTELARHEQYAVKVRAFVASSREPGVLSHESAAAILGLPILTADGGLIHVSVDGSGGGHRSGRRWQHRRPLTDADVTTVDGIAVTTPARTALDIAALRGFDDGVCAVDAALRAGADVQAALTRMGRCRGIASARMAAEFGDGLSESVGESWSRALMARWPDVPAPRLQHRFHTDDGLFVGRADFDWDGTMIGEFDGLGKYSGARTELVDEKRREDGLRALGVHVVRWGWRDLCAPHRLHRILREGFALVRR